MFGSNNTQNVAARDVNVYQGTPIAAPVLAAEINLRSAGNAATEGWVRWFHVVAATASNVAVTSAEVHVTQRGSPNGKERWCWQGGVETSDVRTAGVRIPLVIGAVSQRNEQLATGWWINAGSWHLTPSGHLTLGRYLAYFVPRSRHIFEVAVSWVEGGKERRVEEAFELRFWRQLGSEPRFLRVGDRPTAEDQAGGLGEQRDEGVRLRNEGMTLGVGAFPDWQRLVATWAEETRELIGEVSASDANFFWTLKDFAPVEIPGVIERDPRHLLELRCVNEQLERLQRFMRDGGL